MKKKNRQFDSIFNKLAAQEEAFFGSEFLSPVISGKPIRVKLSGVVMNLTTKNFEGWGVFRATSATTAKFLREPSMQERRQYLELFPVLRLIICARTEEQWFGIPANSGDTRFRISGLIPIRLAQEVQLFETIQARFDGQNCWYEQSDSGANMRNAGTLRDALAKEIDVAEVTASGLTKEEKQAYVVAFIREIENKKDRNEERIKAAIQRAGAEYRSYVERDDSYTVEYLVDGESHRSVVKKDTLEVRSAGICLSGGDRNFDLQSLVGVIREGANRRRIVRVDLNRDYGYGGVDEDDVDYD